MKSKYLRVQIKRLEVTSVDLTFPIFTLNVIESFIPEKAQAYLQKSKIHLSQILEQIKQSEFAPQTILEFEHEEKKFKIWIE